MKMMLRDLYRSSLRDQPLDVLQRLNQLLYPLPQQLPQLHQQLKLQCHHHLVDQLYPLESRS